MKVRPSRLWVPVMAVLLMTGCGDEDPMGNGNGTPPPDISGTYSLVSFQSALLTGGVPIGPPIATGTFTLTQTGTSGNEATGTLSVSITVPDGMGGQNTINDQGTFTVRSDGSWEQIGQLQQGAGTFSIVGNTLTVEVTQPAQAASTSVWQR